MIEKLELEQNPLSETVEKIREICPAAVTRDGKIDFEELKTSLATDVAEDTIEKYEFTWVGKNAAKAEANRPIRKTLRPVVADSKDWDNTKNLYIEGDNLDALKLLQESYLGKVKMIYIDPPYNTGNDFVYCDNFKMGCAEFIEKSGQCDADGNRLFANTKTNGRFHSDWCSMMYSRLKIARNLLTDDGVIFISIDDHEQTNLKKICDEIFGEDNFVSLFVWEKKKKPSFLNTNLGVKTEYVLCYAKQRQELGALSVDTTEVGKKYPLNNAGNSVKDLCFPARSVRFNMGDCVIKKQDMSEGNIITTLKNDVIIKNGVNENDFVLGGEWRYSQSKLNEIIEAGDEIVISKVPFRPNHIKSGGEIKKIHNLLTMTLYPQIGTNEDSTSELINLGFNNFFDYAKPVSLMSFLVKSCTYNDTESVILDFFSGSATTAHAVMQLNAEDGGNRRFIMVQLPEETDPKSEAAKAGYANICEIGKERIRRAGEKIKAENPDKDLDVGFRVLRVDSDNMADIAKRPSDITQGQLKLDVENIVPERSDLDLLFGVMVDCGLMLDMPIETKQMDDKTYYVVNHGDLVACFEKNIPEKLIYEIARMNPVCAVFRDSSFAEPKDKINLAEIFKNITGNDKCVKVL